MIGGRRIALFQQRPMTMTKLAGNRSDLQKEVNDVIGDCHYIRSRKSSKLKSKRSNHSSPKRQAKMPEQSLRQQQTITNEQLVSLRSSQKSLYCASFERNVLPDRRIIQHAAITANHIISSPDFVIRKQKTQTTRTLGDDLTAPGKQGSKESNQRSQRKLKESNGLSGETTSILQ